MRGSLFAPVRPKLPPAIRPDPAAFAWSWPCSGPCRTTSSVGRESNLEIRLTSSAEPGVGDCYNPVRLAIDLRQDNAIGIEHSIKRPASLQPSRPWEKRREDMAEG